MTIYDHTIDIISPFPVFGDGSHETTRFLLYFLNRYVNGKTYIDAGCGTGILSIFAYKRGAASVTSVDIDGNAVECTKNNAKLNGVKVEAICENIANTTETADIVTANFARHDAMTLLPQVVNIAKEKVITTWFKELPKEPLTSYEIIDCIEGIDYDCFVLKINGDHDK